jgi:zinc transporter, ZIP family
VIEAGLWGLAAAASLVVGAVVGLALPVPRRLVALVLGFGAGALVSALAFDLTDEAFLRGGHPAVALGLAAGAVAYFIGDVIIQRRAVPRRGRLTMSGGDEGSSGTGIVLGALLDGIPESVVLGASLIGGLGVSVSFLAAVALSNLPEGIAGARDLREAGYGRRWIIGLWVGVAVASALAAGIGNGLLGDMNPGLVAVIQAFAAGAILCMLADTMFPEAFAHGGAPVGLATVLGFALAFLLSRG